MRKCSRCGTIITARTTYVRKTGRGKGYPISYCRRCHKDTVFIRRWEKVPSRQVKEGINKYQRRISLLQEIVERRGEDT